MNIKLQITAICVAFLSTVSAATLAKSELMINGVSFESRAHWMRLANSALEISGSPCPFAAFGTVIVNHTGSDTGKLICMGVNENSKTGNPSLHAILTDPMGHFQLTPSEAQAAFNDLSLYTNAESCPMCAAAIRWSGFREYIYGTSIDTLIEEGWGQIRVPSVDIFAASYDLPTQSRLIGNLLANETDPFFLWQYNTSYPCPHGCMRSKDLHASPSCS
ncbi:guanine deaminase [Penicillium hetheringtonii]|uniref:Guanine deaminase n=1 Tax=Penicillium hetheringtonii TaxID=911720 RepID=A0AAD6GNP4_9EURO|nr:guanine deaminase [Penicillium hetheringtonii]